MEDLFSAVVFLLYRLPHAPVPGTPFVVAYRQPREEIEILAILHAARKWPDRF